VLGRYLHLGVHPGMRSVPFILELGWCHFFGIRLSIQSVPFIPVLGWCHFLGVRFVAFHSGVQSEPFDWCSSQYQVGAFCPSVTSVPFHQCASRYKVSAFLFVMSMYSAYRTRHSNSTLSAVPLGMSLVLKHSLRLQGRYLSYVASLHIYPY